MRFIQFIRVFLLVLIIIGLGLLATIKLWVPSFTQWLMRNDKTNTSVVTATSDWKTYNNTTYGFSFKYPSSLEVQGADVITIAPVGYEGDGYIFNIRSDDNEYYKQYFDDAQKNKISESDYHLGDMVAHKIYAGFDFGGGINYILFSHNSKKFIIMTDLSAQQKEVLSTFTLTK